jgi:hypothetical protein
MSNCPRNFRDGLLVIEDGTGTPLYLKIPVMDGNVAFTEHTNKAVVKNRGKLYSRRQGDEVEVDVSFDVTFTQYSYANGAATGISPNDALNKTGGAAAWVSTDTACDIYAVTLVLVITDPEDNTKAETLKFTKFSADTVQFKEGDPNKLTVSGKAFVTRAVRTYGTPTYTP